MSLRIAVTGASGFLGKALCDALRKRGHEVLPLVRVNDERAPLGAQLLDDCLSDPARIDVDTVVHAAAIRHRHGARTADYRRSNVELTEHLLRTWKGRFRRFVYVSSVGVYGFPVELPVRERAPFAPRTLYSASKIEAERLVRELAPALGAEFTVARPTITYGTGDTNGMMDKMVRMLRAGSYRVVGDGSNLLHHTHIDDMSLGLALCAEHPQAKNEDFILCGPETITLNDLSQRVADALSVRLRGPRVPLLVARAVASCVDMLAYRGAHFDAHEPPINHEKLDIMAVPIAFDASKASDLLGYRPTVGYTQGIARTLGAS